MDFDRNDLSFYAAVRWVLVAAVINITSNLSANVKNYVAGKINGLKGRFVLPSFAKADDYAYALAA